MSSRGTHIGSFRPRVPWTLPAILPLVAIGLCITGSVARTIAADNEASPPGDGAGPRVEVVPDAARKFISDYCTRCHNNVRKVSTLDLTTLAYDPADAANFALWVKIHDRVAAGEMPPEDVKQPDPSKRDSFVSGLADTYVTSEKRLLAGEGRATQRRMNRFEFENALRDLLGVPMAQIASQLPQDGEAYRYNKSADALDVSYLTMQRFVSAANFAMRTAISQQLNRPAKTVTKLYARDEPSLTRSFRQAENGTLSDRLSFPVLDSRAQQDVRLGRAPLSRPETREREAVGKVSSIFSDAGRYSWSFRAPATGRYRVKLAGYTIWVGGGGIGRWFYEGQGAEKAPVYHLPLWHRPELDEVWPGRNDEPIGLYASGNGQTRPVGACHFTPKPAVCEVDVTLVAGEGLQTDAMRLFRTRVNGTDEQYVNPWATEDGIPGYAVQWIEVEGPFYDGDYQSGYRLLFGDLPLRRVDAKGPGVSLDGIPGIGAMTGGRGFGGRGGGPPRGTGRGGAGAGMAATVVEVDSPKPGEDARRLLRNFLSAAYRRPVEDADVRRFHALFEEQFAKSGGFAKSMLAAYSAVLASPRFVFVEEKPGKLDDVALATRLSLFLWNSTPDATLRDLAARGELRRPDVLRAQTRRLLDDAKSRRFVEAFTDYWLDLRKADETSPSSTIYNDYELDDPLKFAAIEETRLYFSELVRADLPARNVVDSDFTFLNERLASHYGIPGVSGVAMRKVTLPPGSPRGGVMTQAAVLKVTANGTTTSPVIRGHWVTERILGIETRPPPPSVKAVEPDIRGAVTIRQQLEKHRADKSCAACHAVMDPPGFALESFDVMGAFRERYRAVSDDVPPVKGYGLNGQKLEFHWGLPVDSAGELPDGRPFKDVREFKKLLLKDETAVVRNLVRQLSVFATGAPVGFTDRPELEAILARAKPREFGVRTLIEELIQSQLFESK
jgi:Protein of unknown function (DUF1592)/Protein of unknown function (DUF1588)/Protein of unknown function (DUF1585)/Protein of unknown function (DUF1587)/Protein of unknown function (DUF1595)/Planctomycete cytochrome C